MSIAEFLGILSIYTGIHVLIIIWIKRKVDEMAKDLVLAHDQIRKDHNTLANLIAKDYMDKANTLQMYNIMSKATEQKVDAVFKKVDSMSDQVNQIFLILASPKP